MCGLIGYFTTENKVPEDLRKTVRNMWVLDQLRGWHSSGVMILKDDVPTIIKDTGGPNSFWEREGYEDVWDNEGLLSIDTPIFMAHNRHATKGEITAKNAHPFNFRHIWGAHNGSLNGDFADRLAIRERDKIRYEVDTQFLYNHLAHKGIEATWLDKGGAAALTWWDDKQKTLNIIRDSLRPLHFSLSKDGKTIVWSSEAWIMQKGMPKNLQNSFGKIEEFPINTLHVFSINTDDGKLSFKEEKIKSYVPPVAPQNSYWRGGTVHRSNTSNNEEVTSNRLTIASMMEARWPKVFRNKFKDNGSCIPFFLQIDAICEYRLTEGLVSYRPDCVAICTEVNTKGEKIEGSKTFFVHRVRQSDRSVPLTKGMFLCARPTITDSHDFTIAPVMVYKHGPKANDFSSNALHVSFHDYFIVHNKEQAIETFTRLDKKFAEVLSTIDYDSINYSNVYALPKPDEEEDVYLVDGIEVTKAYALNALKQAKGVCSICTSEVGLEEVRKKNNTEAAILVEKNGHTFCICSSCVEGPFANDVLAHINYVTTKQ